MKKTDEDIVQDHIDNAKAYKEWFAHENAMTELRKAESYVLAEHEKQCKLGKEKEEESTKYYMPLLFKVMNEIGNL